MRHLALRALLSVFFASCSVHAALPVTFYANFFPSVEYVLEGHHNRSTVPSQQTIIAWAEELAAQGPWAVTTKVAIAPSGDIHDYLSWAPYWHPDCSNVHNTTELPIEDVWRLCNYVQRDGIFNPDRYTLRNAVEFQTMSDAILYNVMAAVFSHKRSEKKTFGQNAAKFIETWFVANETRMNPNLNYGQMHRGPSGQHGEPTGVLDLKGLTRIASAVLIMRSGDFPSYTAALDTQFVAWCKEYIGWLTSASIALREGAATNNHGTFYANQLAALQLIVDDIGGATATLQKYFTGTFQLQIDGKGEQPLEASRTRPYHYRAYHLAAMITNVQLLIHTDPSLSDSAWEYQTPSGGTIKAACDYAMTFDVPANETVDALELLPAVASVAAHFGDGGTGRYAAFLREREPAYDVNPWFFWNQPLWNGK